MSTPLLVVHGNAGWCQRLSEVCHGWQVVAADEQPDATPVSVAVHIQAHWNPAWVPAERAAGDHACAVVLISPQPPNPASAALFAGIDDWLPASVDDATLAAHVERAAAGAPVSHPPPTDETTSVEPTDDEPADNEPARDETAEA